eukprot:COSAG02_NODE_20540_length_836_cov_1.277854_1_plen_20_part_01
MSLIRIKFPGFTVPDVLPVV